ncbi:MAG: sugar phosphate isomerase/epimerase [Planctomycetaceae bacterium]|nr:sugar phosphate isomerase/epimerase [Planctomycetaceae bacterium]
MRLGLINSAWAQTGRDTAWGIAQTKALGFDSIDIFTDPLDIDVRERRLIKRECDRQGLPIISVCCVATGLVDFNPSVQRFHLDRCRAFLDLVYEYEAQNLLLVLGEYIWNQEVIPPAEQWRTAVENMQRLGEYADRLGIDIALELEPFPLSLLNNVDRMVEFTDAVGHPRVGANLDISHLHLAGVGAEQVSKLQGRVLHVHISDCDGQKHGDLPPGRGVVDFAPYLSAIGQLEIPGAVSIELEYSPDPDRIEEWVQEAYAATASLMKQAGLRA